MEALILDNDSMKLWSKLSNTEKVSLINVAKNYVQLKEETEHISIEQYNKEIEDAMKRIDDGEFYTHDEVIAASKKWINDK